MKLLTRILYPLFRDFFIAWAQAVDRTQALRKRYLTLKEQLEIAVRRKPRSKRGKDSLETLVYTLRKNIDAMLKSFPGLRYCNEPSEMLKIQVYFFNEQLSINHWLRNYNKKS